MPQTAVPQELAINTQAGVPMDGKFSSDGKFVSFVRNGDIWITPSRVPVMMVPPVQVGDQAHIGGTTPYAAGVDAVAADEPETEGAPMVMELRVTNCQNGMHVLLLFCCGFLCV